MTPYYKLLSDPSLRAYRLNVNTAIRCRDTAKTALFLALAKLDFSFGFALNEKIGAASRDAWNGTFCVSLYSPH